MVIDVNWLRLLQIEDLRSLQKLNLVFFDLFAAFGVVYFASELYDLPGIENVLFELGHVWASTCSEKASLNFTGYLNFLIQNWFSKLRGNYSDSLFSNDFFCSNHGVSILLDNFNRDAVTFSWLDLCNQFVFYFKSVKNLWFIGIWWIKAQMTLRKPFRQVQRKRITKWPLQDNIFILRIVKEHIFFVEYRMCFGGRFDSSSRSLIWEMQDYLLIANESNIYLLYVLNHFFCMYMNCTIKWLPSNIGIILIEFNFDKSIHVSFLEILISLPFHYFFWFV